MILVIFLMLSLLSASALAQTGQFDNLESAYAENDYQAVYEAIQPLAEKGFPEFQYQLGFLLLKEGGNIQPDKEASRQWFRKAARGLLSDAASGDPLTLYSLGLALLLGENSTQGMKESGGIDWIRKAAVSPANDISVAHAQYTLAHYYHLGVVVPKDLDRAIYWLQIVADNYPYISQGNLPTAIEMLEEINKEKAMASLLGNPYFRLSAFSGGVLLVYMVMLLHRYFRKN